jgi:hypothetical protein
VSPGAPEVPPVWRVPHSSLKADGSPLTGASWYLHLSLYTILMLCGHRGKVTGGGVLGHGAFFKNHFWKKYFLINLDYKNVTAHITKHKLVVVEWAGLICTRWLLPGHDVWGPQAVTFRKVSQWAELWLKLIFFFLGDWKKFFSPSSKLTKLLQNIGFMKVCQRRYLWLCSLFLEQYKHVVKNTHKCLLIKWMTYLKCFRFIGLSEKAMRHYHQNEQTTVVPCSRVVSSQGSWTS